MRVFFARVRLTCPEPSAILGSPMTPLAGRCDPRLRRGCSRAVLVSTLLSFKKRGASGRRASWHMVEREIRPMRAELENLTAELQKLTHKANDSLDRIGTVVERVEDISVTAARVVGCAWAGSPASASTPASRRG